MKTIGKGESTGGKRPDLLEFVSNAYYITGIDIGRHYVKIVIIDMAAVIMSRECFLTTEEDIKQPEQFLEKIADRVEALITKAGYPPNASWELGSVCRGFWITRVEM